jgi:hypothetical protein
VYLLDLNGREAINPSGNFLTLSLANGTASLLGLNEDCSGWSIPAWEKDLRVRLWWALWVYDVLYVFTEATLKDSLGCRRNNTSMLTARSAISFGRTKTILYAHTVPLPSRQAGNISLDAFVSLCELTVILDKLLPGMAGTADSSSAGTSADLDNLAEAALSLEKWRERVDGAGTLLVRDHQGDSPPGVKSLHLLYLGANLIIVREAWNRAGIGGGVQASCQYACLRACVDIAEFVHGLTPADLAGYWSSGECSCPTTRQIWNE